MKHAYSFLRYYSLVSGYCMKFYFSCLIYLLLCVYQMKHSFSCLKKYLSVLGLDIRRNTPSSVLKTLLFSVSMSNTRLLLKFDILLLFVWITDRGGSRIFFRRGCTRLLLYFNTNKPHSFFFLENTSCIRKPQVISGGGGGGWGAHPLHPPPRSAPDRWNSPSHVWCRCLKAIYCRYELKMMKLNSDDR